MPRTGSATTRPAGPACASTSSRREPARTASGDDRQLRARPGGWLRAQSLRTRQRLFRQARAEPLEDPFAVTRLAAGEDDAQALEQGFEQRVGAFGDADRTEEHKS